MEKQGEGESTKAAGSRVWDESRDDDISSVGPTDYDAESWASRERRRRQAWLNGPSEDEKRVWARSERRKRSDGRSDDHTSLGPVDEEVEAWAERERRRRQAWVNGPSEEERAEWARRERRSRRDRDWDWDLPLSGRRVSGRMEDDLDDLDRTTSRLRREARLAAEGVLDVLVNGPFRTWSRLVRTGRDWEDDDLELGRPRRIRYDD